MKYLNKKQAKRLFDKYLNKECTPEERQLVESYLESHQEGSIDWSNTDFKMEVEEQLWEKIKAQTTDKEIPKVKPLYSRNWLKYAAIFVGAAFAAFAYFQYSGGKQESLDIKEEMVVLQTDMGQDKPLDDNTTGEVKDKSGKVIASLQGGVLKYKKNDSDTELVFNEIDVPLGKTFKLVLSDGTFVHLNAGTHLRFPVGFRPEGNREVFLSGEAYFEVAKNESSPFIVQANDMEVTVLGTHFNVSSYKDETQHTVLVEGSVSVNNRNMASAAQGSHVIKPGQKAIMVPDGLKVNEVDVEDYIGWTQNILVFKDELFPEIIQKIERKYNVEIENNYVALDTARFNGKFGDESIISLMNTFKESANFDYKIQDGKILINKKNNSL